MSTYPVLNGLPIDHWKVTELREELCRRNLSIKGLKAELVIRLFKDIQGDITGGEVAVGETATDDGMKEDGTPGESKEQNVVDSEVATQEGDRAAFEACKEGIATVDIGQEAVAAPAEVSKKTLVVVAEVSDAPLVDVATTDEVSLSDTVATKGDDGESVPSDGAIVMRVYPQAEDHSEIIAEKAPEKVTRKKMIVGDVLSDVASTYVKLDATSAKGTAGAEILEQEAVSSPPNAITLHADRSSADVVSAALVQNAESMVLKINSGDNALMNGKDDEDSKSINEDKPDLGSQILIVGDVLSDVASTDVKLDATSAKGTAGAEILEQEAVSSPPNAITLHADRSSADVVSAALVQNAESMVLKINSGDNALMNGKDDEDSKSINEDKLDLGSRILDDDSELSKHGTSLEKIDSVDNMKLDKTEESPDGGFPDKSSGDEFMEEDVTGTKHVDSNIRSDDLGGKTDDTSEHEVKEVILLETVAKCSSVHTRDIVKLSSIIPTMDDDLPALDDDKELSKNDTSLEEIGSTENINLEEKKENHDGSFSEKLNLDKSFGDELMEEDVMEIKHVGSNIRSEDLGGKTGVTSVHEVKEVIIETVAKGSSVLTKEIVAEEKPATPTEKRKPQEVSASESIKRQRRWNADSVETSKQRSSKPNVSDATKYVLQPALKRSFGKSDSTTSGDSHNKGIVPPAQKTPTTSLRIDGFVRPFTLPAVRGLLGKTGYVSSFWMDHIKTHCYVTYSSVEEAAATRGTVYNLQWPPNNGNYLVAEFVDPHEVKLKLEPPPPPPAPISPSSASVHPSNANQTMPHVSGTSRGLLPTLQSLTKPPHTSDTGPERERPSPSPKKLGTSVSTIDDLFKKTQAYPKIYYLPLSEEEVSAKLAARRKGWRGG